LAAPWPLCAQEAKDADDAPRADAAATFQQSVAPIFERHCLKCHNDNDRKGGLSLATAKSALAGGESGASIEPGDPDASFLLDFINGDPPEMPKDGEPLSEKHIAAITRWIADGAKWPEGLTLSDKSLVGLNWWSLEPLPVVAPPDDGLDLSAGNGAWPRTPVDAFLLARMQTEKLHPSPEADRRTLIRRLYFDLLGLPPSPDEVAAFLADDSPDAYERLVDRLLASPHYGERWARHWLDVVHYGDTHGFDKDKLRPNAWPYRDYVIRSLNADEPYARFVEEQLAGDVLYGDTPDGIAATGFIAAGPFDWVGQVELGENQIDKKITRNLDRDDMVSTTMNTFTSLTAQCARCHNHKFDPITQEDYYSLQAVFAGVDRADRPYDVDPAIESQRRELTGQLADVEVKRKALEETVRADGGEELVALEARLGELRPKAEPSGKPPQYGYHSAIESDPSRAKWVQVDLGREVEIRKVVLHPCHDEFAGIGAGFGFPVRFKVESTLDDAEFAASGKHAVLADESAADVPNPGLAPWEITVDGVKARYIRITATKLCPRQNDYIFALSELDVLDGDGKNVARGAAVTSLDSIEAPVRWGRANLTDGLWPHPADESVLGELAAAQRRYQEILARTNTPERIAQRDRLAKEAGELSSQLSALPAGRMVFAAATHFDPQGNFAPTRGIPRPVYLLERGSEKNPLQEVGPGTVSCLSGLPSRFDCPPDDEGARRVALARWITDPKNPLTWRSIANRVWHYHLGRGMVETPNDFGRMGALPTHPELLDSLAVEMRDRGGSIKRLHRLIVNSAAYRQVSTGDEAQERIDADNRFLWRMNRRRLEAESVRDAVLAAAGVLDGRMYGPGYKPFGFIDDHSPHYLYDQFDPDEPGTRRRGVYRFLVRSVPDPFMETLDCADPSQTVARRNETLTALQALAMLNDKFMVRMAQHFADRVAVTGSTDAEHVSAAFRLALGREPDQEEQSLLLEYCAQHGLANTCRLIFNTNEFLFID